VIAVQAPIKAIETDKTIVGSKYYTHVLPRLEEVYKWLCEGMTEYSIADELGISHGTLIEYKKEYSEIIQVYTRARTQRNSLVMNRMFSRACGEKVAVIKQKMDRDGEIIDLKEEQYIPPDVNAADLYLRNNSEDYKSAKSEPGNLTLIQNNFQLPQISQQIKLLEEELKKLDSGSIIEGEIVPDHNI
jgi:hypothetical protein